MVRVRSADSVKKTLLDVVAPLDEGVVVLGNKKRQDEIEEYIHAVEDMNPTENPASSELNNGVWTVAYCTSSQVLGKDRFGGDLVKNVNGTNCQMVDLTRKKGKNSVVVSIANLWKFEYGVEANLRVKLPKRILVSFSKFILGPIQLPAPSRFKSWLDVTYLDNDMRILRGASGNVFVLVKSTP